MKNFLAFILILIYSLCSAQIANRKNVVFICVDDLKPLLNCYGQNQMITPNFDKLARKGVIFTNAHVQQAVCGPSRASVMTGTYPDHNKVWDLETDFRKSNPNLLSMPQYFKSQGYFTTAIGKKVFHDGSCSPGHDGLSWSEPYKLSDYSNKIKKPLVRLFHNDSLNKISKKYFDEAKSKGLKDSEEIEKYVLKKVMISSENLDLPDEAYEDGIYARDAVSKLKKLAKKKSPFFLAIGFSRPHLPFNAPKKYWDLYDRNKIEVEKFQSLIPKTPKFIYHNFGELRAYNDIDKNFSNENLIPIAKQKELIHGYMACVSYVDAQLGKVLEAIEKEGIEKNTIVVLWGDHGYHLGDHTMWNKHSNFEQATRIPLMFAGPNIENNRIINQPAELLDVFPTLFDLCGLKTPEQVDGISLKNLLDSDDKTTIEKDFAMSQYPRHGGRMGYTIRTEKYRYTEWHNNNYNASKPYSNENIEFIELYDYSNDPLETENKIDKIDPDTVKLLKDKLVKHLQEINKKIN